MSLAEIEKLTQRLEYLWREIMAYRAPELIETLEEYSDAQLKYSLHRVKHPILIKSMCKLIWKIFIWLLNIYCGEGNGTSMSVEIATLVAHWREKDRKKYAQLVVWQSFVVDEMWRRHCGFTQVIIREWWTWKELESWEVVENRKEDSYFVSNSVYNSP